MAADVVVARVEDSWTIAGTSIVFFFFQAEDGIRDVAVTGVQTCALPISSVLHFEYGGAVFNLLDTPGHEDFSEDTYRTLTAVDSAVMVIDAAKGIEARTRKLFEVCRLRDIPIITFINKMDRESRDTFDLLDEIEKTLALDTTPMTWPVGRGRDFIGTYDVADGGIRLLA